MMNSRGQSPHVKIDVGAKLTAKTDIPSASSGRFVDAIVDLIRPVSEGAGWLGDRIQLGRQQTLTKIARLTEKRLHLGNKPIKLPPPKLLLPLIERASLEEVNEAKLIEMWANLLATAATEKVEMLGQYTAILSELTSDQVRILERMTYLGDEGPYDAGHLRDRHSDLNQAGLAARIYDLWEIDAPDNLIQELNSRLSVPGVALDCLLVYYKENPLEKEYYHIEGSDTTKIYTENKFYDFENLVRLGLIEKCELKRHDIGNFNVDISYYIVTPVAADLCACCNPKLLVRENNSQCASKKKKAKPARKKKMA